MMEPLQVFNLLVTIWIALMLTVQSVILYRLLPEIKKVSGNSESLSKIFNIKKIKKD